MRYVLWNLCLFSTFAYSAALPCPETKTSPSTEAEALSFRKKMTAAEIAALQTLAERAAEKCPIDPARPGKRIFSEDALPFWLEQYEFLTGTKAVYAKDLLSFLENHGPTLMQLLQRPIRIGLTTFSGKKMKEAEARQLMGAVFEGLQKRGIPLEDVAFISGLTDLGGVAQGYKAAAYFPQIELQGIASGRAVLFPVAQVDRAVLIGAAWEGESPLFLDVSTILFVLGGGDIAVREARHFIERSPHATVIIHDFHSLEPVKGGQPGETEWRPGAAEKIAVAEGGHHFSGGTENPLQVGDQIADTLAKMIHNKEHERQKSRMLPFALEHAPDSIVEIEQWSKAQSFRLRILTLLRATRREIAKESSYKEDPSELILNLGARIADAVNGIDNFADPNRWRNQVEGAFLSFGEESILATVLPRVRHDIAYMARFGQHDIPESETFFEAHQESAERYLLPVDFTDEHTLGDVARYSNIRLPSTAVAYMKARDVKTEIFLGTDNEMEAFYFAQSLYPSGRIHESNGTRYLYFKGRHGENPKVILHGIDTPSRLNQILLLMKFQQIDIASVVVRGEFDRLRQKNTDLLKMALMEMKSNIAGVVIGNREDAVNSILRAAKIERSDAQIKSFEIGPFRFDAVPIRRHESQEQEYVLAFATAYGELSEIIMKAALRMGVRNFATYGPGATFDPSEEVGATHRMVGAHYKGRDINLDTYPNVLLAEVPGARDARNLFSPAPMEQTKSWAHRAIEEGFNDVDQESGPIFAAIADFTDEFTERSEKAPQVALFPGLYISDVVGKGNLAYGTTDHQYAQRAGAFMDHFFASIGVRSILRSTGSVQELTFPNGTPISPVAPDLIEMQMPTAVDEKLKEMLPTSSILNTRATMLEQIKGEKRVAQIVGGPAFSENDARQVETFLRNLNAPQRFWVQTRSDDLAHGRINQIARGLGYEVIVVSNKQDTVRGDPNVVYSVENHEIDSIFDQFIEQNFSQNVGYSRNQGNHFRLHVGLNHSAPTGHPENHLFTKFLNLGNIEDLALGVKIKSREKIREIERSTAELFASREQSVPVFLDADSAFMREQLRGMTPHVFSGASKKAWPDTPPEQQAKMLSNMRKIIDHLNPAHDLIVTGGTDYGFEKFVHDYAHEKGFKILGATSENASAEELSPHLSHVAFFGVNYFGKARPLARDLLLPFKGRYYAFGGGPILKGEISVLGLLKADIYLQKDVVGASGEMAPSFPSKAFGDAEEIWTRPALDGARTTGEPDCEKASAA